MKSLLYVVALCLFYGVVSGRGVTQVVHADSLTLLPEFTETHEDQWLNSKALTRTSLRGKVVVIDFWTFACWNCYRSFPWLNSIYDRYKDQGLEVVGVHAPEFDYEKRKQLLREKIAEFNLDFPIMIDNEKRYWNAMKNRYWPAYYIIDSRGYIRGSFVGETHAGDSNAVAMEALIQKLLAELS